MPVFKKNSFCSYCGHPFEPNQPWPRQCANCGRISFLNPLPVVVMLVPVDDGLLLIRRGIPPQTGKLALPGGFIEMGKTWQQAGARELFEETNLKIEPARIGEFQVRSDLNGHLMVFGITPHLSGASLPGFWPTAETSERTVANRPIELAFPLHTQAMQTFFERFPPGPNHTFKRHIV